MEKVKSFGAKPGVSVAHSRDDAHPLHIPLAHGAFPIPTPLKRGVQLGKSFSMVILRKVPFPALLSGKHE